MRFSMLVIVVLLTGCGAQQGGFERLNAPAIPVLDTSKAPSYTQCAPLDTLSFCKVWVDSRLNDGWEYLSQGEVTEPCSNGLQAPPPIYVFQGTPQYGDWTTYCAGHDMECGIRFCGAEFRHGD